MKKNALIIALLAASGFISTSAMAADGTITFTGEIKDVTCSVTGGPNFSVPLDPVQASALGSSGKVAGGKPFDITVGGTTTGCPDGTKVAIVFEPSSSAINAATGNLKNTSTDAGGVASNVEIQILDAANANAPIDLRNGDATTEATVASSAAKMPFVAQYIATGAAGAGAVESAVEYSVTFP